MFADWLAFASAFSAFLWNEISRITRESKELKFLKIGIMGYLALTQQRKRKRKLTFSDNAKSAPLTSGPNAERQPVSRQSCAVDFLAFPWSYGVPVAVPVVVALSPSRVRVQKRRRSGYGRVAYSCRVFLNPLLHWSLCFSDVFLVALAGNPVNYAILFSWVHGVLWSH